MTQHRKSKPSGITSCKYHELLPEMDELLSVYLQDGRRRGLQESTLRLYRKLGNYFLYSVMNAGCKNPKELNARNIGAACLNCSSNWYLSHIRTFLRFVYQAGYTDRDYSCLVPLFKRPQPYPSVYTADEIRRIEDSIDQNAVNGKRDYAVLLLATRLGIRSGDIASLTFDELDFERDLITLTQNKTGIVVELPMVPEIKAALTGYIQHGRGDSKSPYVFLCIVPPFGHISVQLIGKIVCRAIRRAGIDPGYRKRGAHAFRSSLASSMVNDDVPYEVVRKTLGHTDQNAIRSYARLDVERLREYALPVPGATGIFADFLGGRCVIS